MQTPKKNQPERQGNVSRLPIETNLQHEISSCSPFVGKFLRLKHIGVWVEYYLFVTGDKALPQLQTGRVFSHRFSPEFLGDVSRVAIMPVEGEPMIKPLWQVDRVESGKN